MSGRPTGGIGSLFLIDANNFMFRAYHALPMLSAPDGRPVNAIHGFVRMVQALRREFAPEYLLAIFDATDGDSWRKKIYPQYKGNRAPPPEDLQPQIPMVREATAALSIPWLEDKAYEADDLIARYAQEGLAQGLEVVIVSSDKDLQQLVSGEDDERASIRMWDTMKNRRIGPAEVRENWGVGPELLGDLLALAGDSSDNIPGVAGIGPKTASGLLEEFGSLEGILANTDKIKGKRREKLEEHAADARMSRKLVALATDYPLPRPLAEIRDPGPDRATMDAFFEPLGFKSTLSGAVGTRSGAGARRVAPKELVETLSKLVGVEIPSEQTRLLAADAAKPLREFLARAKQAGSLAFEFELSGEDPMRADVIGLAMAIPAEDPTKLAEPPVYVPVGHRGLGDLGTKQWKLADLLELVGPTLRDLELRKHGHSVKNQDVVLLRPPHACEVEGLAVDTMLASYLLDPARPDHELEGLAKDLLGRELGTRESLVGRGKKQVGYDQVDLSLATPWAGERVGTIAILARHLGAAIVDSGEQTRYLFDAVELPLAKVLARLERRGILLDTEELARQAEDLGRQITELSRQIDADAGYSIDPNSTKQLGKLLFEDRGLPAKKKTKTGGYSTDAQTLEELALPDPIVKLVLDYRSLTKLKGTYLDSLPGLISGETGRLHTHFHQAVAATGRLSSSEPNLQNIPIRTEQGRKIRRGFIAPKGMKLVTLDYSQIELRVLAHLSKDPNLSAAFREGADVHRRTAAEVFEVPEAEVTDEQRRVAKAVNFGVIYGQTAFGLARSLNIPQGRAGKYIKAYFKKIPGISAYMDALVDMAKQTGFAETILGRRRRIPELQRKGGAMQAYGERIARNTPIQGSAADILKIAMVEVEKLLADQTWARMLLTVHDELIFECEAKRSAELIALVKPVMENAVALDVPLVVEAGEGKTWEDAKG